MLVHSRKEKGLTQQELAYKVGVSTKTISRWENGSSSPDIHSLKRLSMIFETPLDQLIDESTIDYDIDEPLDTSMINRFFLIIISSIGLSITISASLLIGYSYYTVNHNVSTVSIVLGNISIFSLIAALIVFVIAIFTFSTKYKTKKLHRHPLEKTVGFMYESLQPLT